MPLINNAVDYTPVELSLIANKVGSDDFSHENWSDDDLRDLRVRIRNFYRNEQYGVCAYCKGVVSLQSASNSHIEHIAPKSLYLNFIFEPENLCVVCADCNEIKRSQEVMNKIPDTLSREYKRYPISSAAFKIVHPHIDNYDDHILIFDKIYVDRSTKGAETIKICKLNRFFHKFDLDDEVINDNEVLEAATELVEASSNSRRLRLLNKIRGMILRF